MRGSVSKRTRSSKRVVVDESSESVGEAEDQEEEAESGSDGNKALKNLHTDYDRRKLLRGRLLTDLEEEGMVWFLERLEKQGWKDMVLKIKGKVARDEVVEFFFNCSIDEGRINSTVNGKDISFEAQELGELFDIPFVGYDDYVKGDWPNLDGLPTALEITYKFAENPQEVKPRAVEKCEMQPRHQLFEFVYKILFPRQEKRFKASFLDLVLMELLDSDKQINWPIFMVHLIIRVVAGKKKHALPFGFILTDLFDKLGIQLKEVKNATKKQRFGAATLISCDMTVNAEPATAGATVAGPSNGPLNNKVRVLRQQVDMQAAEIKRLEEERDFWKAEAAKANRKRNK